jgi:hypothetical protein
MAGPSVPPTLSLLNSSTGKSATTSELRLRNTFLGSISNPWSTDGGAWPYVGERIGDPGNADLKVDVEGGRDGGVRNSHVFTEERLLGIDEDRMREMLTKVKS